MPRIRIVKNKPVLNSKDALIVENWRQDTNAIKKYSFLRKFLPQEEKRQRSPFLSQNALIIYSLFFSLLLATFKLTPKFLPGVLGYASDIYMEELLKYTNEKRASAGLSPLKMNEELSLAAEAKAHDMFEKNYWAHVSPDGVEPWDFIISAGYDYSFAGENLAKNFNSSKEVVDAWYESESHRENLLGANYQDIGFAIVNGILDGYETTLVVQTFGKPRVPTYLSSAEPEPFPELPKKAVEVPVTDEVPATSNYKSSSPVTLNNNLVLNNKDIAEYSPEFLDIVGATNLIGFSFITFLALLLIVDIWYSNKKGIRKVNGHTFAHLLFLAFVFAGIWFALTPGKIL